MFLYVGIGNYVAMHFPMDGLMYGRDFCCRSERTMVFRVFPEDDLVKVSGQLLSIMFSPIVFVILVMTLFDMTKLHA